MIVNFIKDRLPRAPLAKRNLRGASFLVESDLRHSLPTFSFSHSKVKFTGNTPDVLTR